MWSGPGDPKSDLKDMFLWTPENAYNFQHHAYDPTMPHIEFVWPTPEGRARKLAGIYPNWSSLTPVGSVPKGVRKITTCKVEPKPNGDVTICKIAKNEIPIAPPSPSVSPMGPSLNCLRYDHIRNPHQLNQDPATL